MDSVEGLFLEVRSQCAEAWRRHDVPRFTLFPMSQNAHFIMYASDCGVGAERFLSRKMLTPFADIPVVRAL
jgi:hypothetical protein